ncbi:MAG: ATP synthase F0 subunit B [Proteobacteria bacterium]|jgi:F-type H+-transporting ATPase subunit b|nr:ATP synthase F0 subunit B [Pseudomonadota bacterium]
MKMTTMLLQGIKLAVVGFALAVSPLALAEPPPTHGDLQPTEEGDAPGDHGEDADAHGEGEHAEGEHHIDYIGDADEDGWPNWLDYDHEGFMPIKLGLHLMNLLILVGIVIYAAGRPISDAVKNRALTIRKRLTDSARRRDEAEHQYEELLARLSHFEDEVTAMRQEARKLAADDEARLVERAHQEADRIGETGRRNIRDETVRARYALRREAVDLAVQLAEQTLQQQIQASDQRRLAREFLDSLNDGGVNG